MSPDRSVGRIGEEEAMAAPKTVEAYFAALPDDQREALQELRDTIRSALPDAAEHISYQMPAFKEEGRFVVWYAAFRDHYSMYPASEGVRTTLGQDLEKFLSGKGTIRFEYGERLPKPLVNKIVKARLKENAEGTASRRSYVRPRPSVRAQGEGAG
jgi:uncharacterized protein YdhG (YjbR/CyaY superfamily)